MVAVRVFSGKGATLNEAVSWHITLPCFVLVAIKRKYTRDTVEDVVVVTALEFVRGCSNKPISICASKACRAATYRNAVEATDRSVQTRTPKGVLTKQWRADQWRMQAKSGSKLRHLLKQCLLECFSDNESLRKSTLAANT